MKSPICPQLRQYVPKIGPRLTSLRSRPAGGGVAKRRGRGWNFSAERCRRTVATVGRWRNDEYKATCQKTPEAGDKDSIRKNADGGLVRWRKRSRRRGSDTAPRRAVCDSRLRGKKDVLQSRYFLQGQSRKGCNVRYRHVRDFHVLGNLGHSLVPPLSTSLGFSFSDTV